MVGRSEHTSYNKTESKRYDWFHAPYICSSALCHSAGACSGQPDGPPLMVECMRLSGYVQVPFTTSCSRSEARNCGCFLGGAASSCATVLRRIVQRNYGFCRRWTESPASASRGPRLCNEPLQPFWNQPTPPEPHNTLHKHPQGHAEPCLSTAQTEISFVISSDGLETRLPLQKHRVTTPIYRQRESLLYVRGFRGGDL
jgi:hypothetical protein